jgi:hypothetical protein
MALARQAYLTSACQGSREPISTAPFISLRLGRSITISIDIVERQLALSIYCKQSRASVQVLSEGIAGGNLGMPSASESIRAWVPCRASAAA